MGLTRPCQCAGAKAVAHQQSAVTVLLYHHSTFLCKIVKLMNTASYYSGTVVFNHIEWYGAQAATYLQVSAHQYTVVPAYRSGCE